MTDGNCTRESTLGIQRSR